MENFKIYWGVNIIEFKQIEYFEAVSRLKSYTKAAKELFITQPSITVAIRKLEEELGVKLIERDNKSLYLTEAGEIFLIHAKEVLDKMKETTRIMADIQSNNKKILKFAFPPAMGAWLWSEIYPNFTNKYPNIDIEIEDLGTKEIIDAIKEGKIELGFGVLDMVEDKDLETMFVKKGEIKVLINSNHRYKDLEKIPIEFLCDETYIQYKRNKTFIEKRILEEFKSYQINPSIMYVKEQSSAYDLVSKCHGFAATLDDSISILKNNTNIISKPLKESIYFHSGLIWSKDKYLSEAARDFIKFIIK